MNTMVAVEKVQQCKVVVCENEIVFKKAPAQCPWELWADPSRNRLSVCIIIATEWEYNH